MPATFFQSTGFICSFPIISASDAEGAGEMFQVTTLPLNNIPKVDGEVDYSKDFFGKAANLTVSGQLEAETFALAFKKVYTFGPTFRAENSNTTRHASEFWMIEPEVAFADLNDDMNLIEKMLKYVIKYILKNAKDELAFFDEFVAPGKIKQLQALVASKSFAAIIKMPLLFSKGHKQWEKHTISYGDDFASEHEKIFNR
jgi:asparaginyl-tRNA synthetase